MKTDLTLQRSKYFLLNSISHIFNQFSNQSFSLKKKSSLITFIGLLSFQSWGQSIFTNPITGTNPNSSNPYTTGQTIASGITVSGIGRGTGITDVNTNDRYNANGWNSGSLNVNDYFEWTITPGSCKELDFVSFNYTSQVSNSSISNFAFRSSLDNYTTNIGTPTSSGTTISLSNLNFQNIKSPIKFRLYAWGANSATRTFSINDFTFNGVVSDFSIELPITSVSQSFCSGSKVSELIATGNSLQWYSSNNGGSNLSTETVLNDGVYYVSQNTNGCESSTSKLVGLTSFGTSNSNSLNRGLVFNLTSNIILKSFKLQSDASGSVTITLTNVGSNTNFSKSKTVTITSGENTIIVGDWGIIPAGTDYKLLLTSRSTGIDLTRTTSFTFPLNFIFGSITGNNESDPTRYNYFYSLEMIEPRPEVTVSVNQPSTSITVNGVTIGDGDYLWNGNINSNGNVKNNWYILNDGVYSLAAQVPQASDEVFVVSAENAISCVSNSNNLTIPAAGNFNSSNLNIGENASVSLGNGSSFNVKGDFINDGNFNAGSGTVVMNGTSLQKIKGSAANTTFKNLTIDNSNGVKIEKDIVIDSVLSLTNGLIDLASNHMTIGASASIHGTPASSKMIVASGTGELRKQFSPGTYNPASFTFPVGTSNGTNKYNPVVLDFASATFGSAAYVGVKVQDQKNTLLHSDNTTYINKNWIVEPNNDVSNFNYSIKLYFNPATLAQGGDFVSTSGQTIGDLIPVKYSGGQWYQPMDGTFSNALSQGTAGVIITNYLTWDGLTTFSEFGGVGGSNNPLPVELLSFNGTCNEGMVNLAWQTASEFNSSHFDVEKSTDGETWRVLATIPSAGISNELLTYQSVDNNATNGSNYYRLRQVDNDGKEKLYDPINVSCVETTTGYFTSYPNPSGSEFQVVINNKEIHGTCKLNILDAHGKVINQRSIEVNEGINMFVINQELTTGIYFLSITDGIKSTQVIKHAVK